MLQRLLVTIFAILALVLTGCGGETSDSKPADGDASAKKVENDEPKLANDDIEKFFKAISSADPDRIEGVKSLAAPDSVAAAYAQQQQDVINAGIDGGVPQDESTLKKVDKGYENCPSGQPDSCIVWDDFEAARGKLAKFTVDDIDITDRISIGDGSTKKAGDLATLEFRSAYKSVQSGHVFVSVLVTSSNEKINIGSYEATYRGVDKRQSTAVDVSGLTELDADSVATLAMVFKAAEVGGTVKVRIMNSEYANEQIVEIKTQ